MPTHLIYSSTASHAMTRAELQTILEDARSGNAAHDVTGLLVYNSSFYWGFQNFVVGLPFALAALAIWIGTERRHILWRLVLLTPLATAIYLMHFYVFFALAVAAAGRGRRSRPRSTPPGRRAGR